MGREGGFMIALLEWTPPERGKRKKSVTVKEESVLHLAPANRRAAGTPDAGGRSAPPGAGGGKAPAEAGGHPGGAAGGQHHLCV